MYVERVRDLIHRPGEMRERDRVFPVPEQLGAGLVTVPAGQSLELRVRLESVHEGILASVEVRTQAVGECVRCLSEITQSVGVDFQELFAYSSDEACEYEVQGDCVDLEPALRDAVVLSLPFQPLCDPDCLGLNPETGEKLTPEDLDSLPTHIDPRWAAIAQFAASTPVDEDTGSAS